MNYYDGNTVAGIWNYANYADCVAMPMGRDGAGMNRWAIGVRDRQHLICRVPRGLGVAAASGG